MAEINASHVYRISVPSDNIDFPVQLPGYAPSAPADGPLYGHIDWVALWDAALLSMAASLSPTFEGEITVSRHTVIRDDGAFTDLS